MAQGRFDGAQGPCIVGPRDGGLVDLGALGVRFMIDSTESGGGFSLVEHPIPPRSLWDLGRGPSPDVLPDRTNTPRSVASPC